MEIKTLRLSVNEFMLVSLLLLHQGYKYTTASGASSKCPDLVSGPNQIVSSSEAYVGDSVQVSCDSGFTLDVGTLTKTVSCVDNASVAVWDDGLGDCTPKTCGVVLLGENMTVTDGVPPFLIGDNVTVTCATGRALSVDLNQNGTDRVVASQILSCLDDPASPDGRWTELTENCTAIECSAPIDVSNSDMEYNTTTYGSTIIYRCHSGRKLGGAYTRVATCTEYAVWDMTGGFDLESGGVWCGTTDDYTGCISSSFVSVQDSYSTSPLNADDCIHHCRSQSYRFASLYSDTCSCGNGLADDFEAMDDVACNTTCAGNDGSDEFQSTFCGGSGPLSSVYVTVDGCFENVTVDLSESEEVLAEEKVTCQERCRARDFSHAAIYNTTCICLNTSQVDGTRTDKSYCDSSETPQFIRIHDLAKSKVEAENCSGLFDSGVRMHGTYMMSDGTKTYCNFKDGTICDDGWIGYLGNCYLFHVEQKMNFSQARDFCLGQESDMVSILNSKEAIFMRNTRRSFTDLKEKGWYVGMIDSHNVSLFSWLDGNLFRYSRFGLNQPSGVGLCIRDVFESYLWASIKCSLLQYVVCKKTESINKCASVNLTEAIYIRAEPTMTLPYCVEICRGKSANYSAVSGTDCYCFPQLPAGTEFALKRQCDIPCPGDPYQYCGNADNFTLIEVPGRIPAQSCEDLQLVGIGNGSFIIQKDNDASLQDCAIPECPYAWLEIRGRCYRFNPVLKTSTAARKYCSVYDAYPVVLETVQETEELMITVSNISVYNSTKLWRIGLQSLSLSSGLYRWANGKITSNSLWSNNFTVHGGVEVLVPKDNYTEWQERAVGEYAFMCEKGQDILDYLGCYNGTGLISDYNTTSNQMTIQQCVEWCRGGGRFYAFLWFNECRCSDDLPQHAGDGAYCYTRCAGQQNQVCGGTGLVSVYNISEYLPVASQCSNLTDASIFLSGTYEVGGGLERCNLSDTTICDDTWLGYNGDCYKYDADLQKSNNNWWYDNDVVMTSITTANEEQFLKDYLQRLYLGYSAGRVISGLKDTYQLRIFSHQDGLLFKPADLTSNYPISQQFTVYVGFETEGFGLSLHGDELGFIAKKDRYKLGCFEIPGWMTPILSHFNSMELTQCKQLCLAIDTEVTLMTLDACYCGNANLTDILTPSLDDKCMNACQVHPWQWYGDLGSAIAYRVVEDEAHLAPDCGSLYLSGVFYNTTYKLWNGTAARLDTCGFTDNTLCPATWFGKEGQCYKIFVIPKNLEDARLQCFQNDSYLFNPTKNSPAWSILEILNTIDVLKNDTDLLMSGIRTIFYNTTYVTSNGIRLTFESSPTIVSTAVPENYAMAFVIDTAVQDYQPDIERPYVCQKYEDYFGCSRIHTLSVANISNVIDISLTLCREYCRGKNAIYFATSETSCHCYNTLPSFTAEKGKCETACRGANTQPCGGNDNGTVLFSLFRIGSTWTSFASSCTELARYGVRCPGEYYIEPDVTVGAIKVTCFHMPSPVSMLTSVSYKELTVSSSLDPFDTAKTFHKYGLHEVWKANTNDVNQNIKLSLDGIHIVTGVIISGIQTHGDISWVTKIKITYRDPLSGSMVEFIDNGTNQIEANVNGIDQSYIFLSQPFITEEVVISPLEWHTSIALKIFLLGQLYKEFDHGDFYIGCVFDYADMFTYFGAGSLCDEPSGCATIGHSFMALDGNGSCYCGSGYLGFQHGFVDGHCNLNGTKYVGEGTLYKALYRAYEKKCLAPGNITDGHIFNATYPYVNDVYTYGARTTYVCDVGYEFDDGSSDVTTACRQDNMWDNITQSCHIISCPPFNVTNGTVDIISLQYLGEANVMCDPSHWAENGEQNLTVTCQADKTWNINVTCKENNLKENIRYFNSHGKKKRDSITVMIEDVARSTLECTVKCTTAYYCKGANFKKHSDGKGTCLLFANFADATHLTDNLNWRYYETYLP